MKDHLPLILIALFGVSGLFQLHREEKSKSQEKNMLVSAKLQPIGSPHYRSEFSPFSLRSEHIQVEADVPEIVEIVLHNLDPGYKYWLDCGNDCLQKIHQPIFSIKIEDPGIFSFRLFKENKLIDSYTYIH